MVFKMQTLDKNHQTCRHLKSVGIEEFLELCDLFVVLVGANTKAKRETFVMARVVTSCMNRQNLV